VHRFYNGGDVQYINKHDTMFMDCRRKVIGHLEEKVIVDTSNTFLTAE
jgi:hypothetical protein